jgi:hypothetical protein
MGERYTVATRLSGKGIVIPADGTLAARVRRD